MVSNLKPHLGVFRRKGALNLTIFYVLLFMTQLICRINAISIYIYLDTVTYGSFLVPNENSNILSRLRLCIKYDTFIGKVMYLRLIASLYLKIAVYVCETAQWRIQRGGMFRWFAGTPSAPPVFKYLMRMK